jgi:hypothetical protein
MTVFKAEIATPTFPAYVCVYEGLELCCEVTPEGAGEDGTYTWSKVTGPGDDYTFTPNGTTTASCTTFHVNTPGIYTVKVEYERCGSESISDPSGDIVVFNADLNVRRKGSGEAYAGSAMVAAGKLSSDVHKADVEVSATPAVSGIPIDVQIKSGEGGGQPGTGGEALLTIGGTTDANGKITGTYKSSNRIEDVTLEARCGSCQHLLDTAAITQKWDDTSITPRFSIPDLFLPGEGSECTFFCRLAADTPIDGHSVVYSTTAMTLSWCWWNLDTDEEDCDTEEYVSPFDNLPFGCSEQDLVSQGDMTESEPGVYVNTQTVYDYFDLVEVEGELIYRETLVEAYDFLVTDQTVYSP